MKIKRVVVGPLDTNCYILEKENQVLVIDPGDEVEKIRQVIGSAKVLKVLITHKHFDHIGALYDIMDLEKIESLEADTKEEAEYKLGPFTFEVIKTPGHSKDSICFYFKKDKVMFVGDFIFKRNIGRCDLPTGSFNEMKKSIEKIKKYPKDIILYPGHGSSTTLEEECLLNPYFFE